MHMGRGAPSHLSPAVLVHVYENRKLKAGYAICLFIFLFFLKCIMRESMDNNENVRGAFRPWDC